LPELVIVAVDGAQEFSATSREAATEREMYGEVLDLEEGRGEIRHGDGT